MTGRQAVLDAHAAGRIETPLLAAALDCVDGTTAAGDYQKFARVFLLAAGLVSIAVGIGFFIAFNWADLERFGKFALVVGAILLSTLAHLLAPKDSAVGQVSQVLVIMLIGTLLALSGQVYQTGADRWQLFAAWALLTLPLVLTTRSFWSWLVWLVVADFAAALYAMSASRAILWLWADERTVYWSLGLLNALVALSFTFAPWLLPASRWRRLLVQIAVITLGTCATLLAMHAIISAGASGVLGFVAWLAVMTGIYIEYRIRHINLALLSGFALSMIAVIITAFIRLLEEVVKQFDAFWLLLIALLILGLATAAGRWLYAVQRLEERGA